MDDLYDRIEARSREIDREVAALPPDLRREFDALELDALQVRSRVEGFNGPGIVEQQLALLETVRPLADLLFSRGVSLDRTECELLAYRLYGAGLTAVPR